MAMQSVLCEVGNKWLNIDYFNFRLHRLTQPAIIRCTSACAGHVNNDHQDCAACVPSIKQGTWTKAWQMTKKNPLLGSWKEAREKSVTKSMHSPVEANHSRQSKRSPAGLIHSPDNLHQRIHQISSESLLQSTVLPYRKEKTYETTMLCVYVRACTANLHPIDRFTQNFVSVLRYWKPTPSVLPASFQQSAIKPVDAPSSVVGGTIAR
jgi:hypothetical protein